MRGKRKKFVLVALAKPFNSIEREELRHLRAPKVIRKILEMIFHPYHF